MAYTQEAIPSTAGRGAERNYILTDVAVDYSSHAGTNDEGCARHAPIPAEVELGSGRISDELWNTKSAELEAELQRVRGEMARHERASRDYETTGVQILVLAQSAHSLYVTRSPHDQAQLTRTLLSNCAFDRGSVTAAYVKPFDLFAKGAENCPS